MLGRKQINRISNLLIFAAACFVQTYTDGRYIAAGQEPVLLKLLKYGLIAVGILWGFVQLTGKRYFVFRKELARLLLVFFLFLIWSLFLMLFRGGNLGGCLEYILRYCMSVLYAFVLLNLLEQKDICRLMACALTMSVFGFVLEKGGALLDWQNYARIAFRDSYSPFESSYFAAPSIHCCAFFLYYRKKKMWALVSFLFVLMTFKRPQIVFAVIFLLLPLFTDPDRQIRKSTHFCLCAGTVAAVVLWCWLMLPQQEGIVQRLTGQTAAAFTSGRSTVLRRVLDSGYQMGGLGSSALVMGRTIEMDLVMFLLEMSLPVMALFVFCFASLSGRRLYAVAVMVFQLFSMMTGSGLYNVMGMLLLYLFFGSVNYLQPEVLGKAGENGER